MDQHKPDPAATRSGTDEAEHARQAEEAERTGRTEQVAGAADEKKPAGLPHADKLGDFA